MKIERENIGDGPRGDDSFADPLRFSGGCGIIMSK